MHRSRFISYSLAAVIPPNATSVRRRLSLLLAAVSLVTACGSAESERELQSLQYSTYIGGGSHDRVTSVAVDSAGNIYVGGTTQSLDFLAQPPLSPADAWSPVGRVFLTKIAADGTVAYSRFLNEGGSDIAIDAAGNVYLAGTVSSAQSSDVDAVVTKLDASGSIVYSVRVGGSGDDFGLSVAVDASGNVALAGRTESADFGAVEPVQGCATGPSALSTGADAFLARFDRDGRLVQATCLGGSDSDEATDVITRGGSVYLLGSTRSRDFPTSAGVVQSVFGPNRCPPPVFVCRDLFVMRIGPPGQPVAYSTLFGGNNVELPGGLAVDGSGTAYISGQTSSTDLPTRVALQPTCRTAFSATDCGDAFVASIDPSGRALVYSTYLGGSGFDIAQDLAVTDDGQVYVGGYTWSMDFPGRPVAATTKAQHTDAFIVRLDPLGSLAESAFYGGSREDFLEALALGPQVVVASGFTDSTDFPLMGAFQSVLRGERDGFVLRVSATNRR